MCVSASAVVLASCRSASLCYGALYLVGCIVAAGGERGEILFKAVVPVKLFFSLIANQYVHFFFFIFFEFFWLCLCRISPK